MNRKERRANQSVNKANEALAKLATEAVAYHRAGQWAEAERIYKRILASQPNSADVNNNLGSVVQKQGRLAEAIRYYERALTLNPGQADAHTNLGNVLRKQKRFEEAERSYKIALNLNPNLAEAHNNYGSVLRNWNKLDEAIACFQQAVALRPDYAEAHNSLGNAFKDQNRLQEASQSYKRAIEISPEYSEPHWGLAYVNLLNGNFTEGWPGSEWRLRSEDAIKRNFGGPVWDGSDLNGKTILLHTEQGLGDAIQFIRYAPLVKAFGGTVVLFCSPAVEKLFQTAKGIDGIYSDLNALPCFDCTAPLMSLPALLKAESEQDIPADVPYLSADRMRQEYWNQQLTGLPGFKVGIVWRGNPDHRNDHNRSMSAEQFSTILTNPELCVVNLQKDATQEELDALRVKGSFFNPAASLTDFSETAALINCLDLVISVDTSVCHLAGALGRDVWVLIPFAPDWRWMLNRSSTPWYPTMQLFRQEQTGDWKPVLKRVAIALSSQTQRGTV